MSHPSQSTLVVMSNMPQGVEPAWIWKSLLSRDYGNAVKEIEMADGFYVHTDTPETAQAIATQFNGTSCGPKSHLYKKAISVRVVPITEAPEADCIYLRLTDFLHPEVAILRTKTVLVRGLPRGHPKAAVKAMCEQVIDRWNINDDPDLGPLTKDTNPRVLHIEMDPLTDEALVRFTSREVACEMVAVFDGGFWNNDTTYAKCVPDSELDDIMSDMAIQGATAKLFVGGMKPGTSTNDIRNLFHPHVPKDIHIPPGGRHFAFVFLPKDAAERFINEFPKGKRHAGWTYHVKYAAKKGKTNMHVAGPKFLPEPVSTTRGTLTSAEKDNTTTKATTTDEEKGDGHAQNPVPVLNMVRLIGLPFSTSLEQVQDFCEKYGVNPKELHIEKGQATLNFAGSAEADDAALILNQNKIQKKKVIAVRVE